MAIVYEYKLDISGLEPGMLPVSSEGKDLFDSMVTAGKIIGFESSVTETVKHDEVLYVDQAALDEHMAESKKLASFAASGVSLVESSFREATEADISRLSF